jgi:multidrug efflux pump subunit AcrA (membrane-fusion protein)
LRKDATVGEIAGTGLNDVLFWVGNPKPLEVDAEVNEEDIAKVAVGQNVLLRHDGFPGATLPARVGHITPKGDPGTKTFSVTLQLPEDTPLKIGMSVEANIIIREAKGVLLVPVDALTAEHVQIVADGRIKRQAVKTGIRGSQAVEIRSGLDEDT